jgi:hypothetical protein
MKNIPQLFSELQDATWPTRQTSDLMRFAQADGLFHLAVAKEARIELLRRNFDGKSFKKVFLSANLIDLQCEIVGLSVQSLPKMFFEMEDPVERSTRKKLLVNSLVIINNNDLGSVTARRFYQDFYADCLSTCFMVWDWDNHHWLELSTFAAAHSDVYAPAHHENLYLLSRFNWLIVGPVYCSCVQWSHHQLTESLPDMLLAERSNEPLGMHIPYVQFSYRMQVISTLNRQYPTVGFSSHGFHKRTAQDRMKEWYSHKMHWIAPVLNDVPIRIFDALITGGIPIVPKSMQLLPPIANIARDHIVFYGPADIVNAQKVVNEALDKFDNAGRGGIAARHRLALSQFHGQVSVWSLVRFASEAMGSLLGNQT